MKVFLLNPLILEKSMMNIRKRQPLSMATISSILKKDGHKVELLDANIEKRGLSETINKIKRFCPDMLIVTTSSIDRWECPNSHINSVFEIIKGTDVKYKTILGAHGTVMPQWIFDKCDANFVIGGEPELTIKKLLKKLSFNKDYSNLNGVYYRQDGEIISGGPAVRIVNLDELPFPDYSVLLMDKYSNYGFKKPFSIMMTSRGCPYHCIYCLKSMTPGKYIAQSPKRVVDEIEYLIKKFGIRSIYFQDWEFLIDINRVKGICQIILERGLNFEWGCNARADDIIRNKEIVSLMKKAGCFNINMGLESGSEKILSNIKKNITLNDLKQAIFLLKDFGIKAGFYVLLNCPGEDKNTIKETIDFINENEIKVKKFGSVIPYPGTILFEKLKKQYPNKKFNWENIEQYAGSVETEMNPIMAMFFLRNYKYQKKYGILYFLSLKFWSSLLRRKL